MRAQEPVYSTAMREMPNEERPRERLAQLGAEALSNAELLAIIFRTGTRREGAVALADRVINQFGGLRGLSRATVEELKQVHGLGAVKAIEIKAGLELGKRLAVHTEHDRVRVRSSQDVADFLMVHYKECETEQFKCLLLNTKNEVLRVAEVSDGGLDATMALPRDVFRRAVREGAPAVIVTHNHPSGDPEPSRDDIALTKRLSEAAGVLGIRMLDHIVFGDGRYVSLKERNLL